MKSNFYLKVKKEHSFANFDLGQMTDQDIADVFSAYISNMEEVLSVVRSSFKLTLHGQILESANRLHDRNLMLAYADGLEHGYSDDKDRINEEASSKTKSAIENEELGDDLIEKTISILEQFANDPVISGSNFATLRQSIVIVWSATESLIRDIIRFTLNSDIEKAISFFECSETSPYWNKKQISFEHMKKHRFDMSNKLGDVALDINPCSNLNAMKVAYSSIFGRNEKSTQALSSAGMYQLYKLRNVIAHRNGIVDEKFKSETSCNEEIGDRVHVFPNDFSECFLQSKTFAEILLQEISNKCRHSDS
ncbi:hypothetical protein MGA5115_02051 [Marinomonas gallaica]|uniref:RiboL-PSP-HEPN domain-containing protein n=1 Tax=Marinomonas gallaica TaxID=1806667 RepID=A0A1C3JRU7_9GAMM|nr:hypothetical protein [Marinomonas gallaica]SBT17934.1 hypothetical protein MGA5115_02051 [Marinomonas gallaica]SBT20766.1 hypothetical protein MGA5116_01353 [Marinomonas gallaica]